MKTTEQEIIDMERYYETATLEEAIAYFRMKSAQCFNVIKDLIYEVKSIIKGICRFFIKPKSNARKLRENLGMTMIYKNTLRSNNFIVEASDLIVMEKLLVEAQTILIKK